MDAINCFLSPPVTICLPPLVINWLQHFSFPGVSVWHHWVHAASSLSLPVLVLVHSRSFHDKSFIWVSPSTSLVSFFFSPPVFTCFSWTLTSIPTLSTSRTLGSSAHPVPRRQGASPVLGYAQLSTPSSALCLLDICSWDMIALMPVLFSM